MRRKRKKGLAMLLAAAMTLSLSTASFADTQQQSSDKPTDSSATTDELVGTQDDIGRITVSGVSDASDTLEVRAYPIVLAAYDESGSFAGYTSLYEVIDLDECLTDAGYEFSEAQLDYIRELIAVESASSYSGSSDIYSYPEGEDSASAYGDQLSAMKKLDEETKQYYVLIGTDGTYTANVALGAYLIVIHGAESVIYNVAVASSYYVTSDEGTAIYVDTVDMKENGSISNEETWVKAETPTLSKAITNTSTNSADGTLNDGNAKGTSVCIGDRIDYQVTVTGIPYYEGAYPVYLLTDTLDAGLTASVSWDKMNASWSGITVSAGTNKAESIVLKQGSDYTVSVTLSNGTVVSDGETDSGKLALITGENLAGASITISFVTHDLIERIDGTDTQNNEASCPYDEDEDDYYCNGYHLNSYEGTNLYITYTATLNAAASYNSVSNDNTVTLTYTTDSTESGHDKTEEDKTHVYTFDIDGGTAGSGEAQYSDTWRIITKTGSEENKNAGSYDNEYALSGAQFVLYQKDENGDISGYATWNADGTFAGWSDEITDACYITSDSSGQFAMAGLAAGTYYFKEITAPSGYILNSIEYQIEISASYTEAAPASDTAGELTGWTITVSTADSKGEVSTVGKSTFTVSHTPAYSITSNWDVVSLLNAAYSIGADGSTFAAVEGEQNHYWCTTTVQSSNTTTTTTTYDAFVTMSESTVMGASVIIRTSVTEGQGEDAVTTTTVTGYDTLTFGSVTGASGTVYTVEKVSEAISASETEILNVKGTGLPNTGGAGTHLFTLIGLLFIAAAAGGLLLSKKKQARAFS